MQIYIWMFVNMKTLNFKGYTEQLVWGFLHFNKIKMSYEAICKYMPSHIIFVSIHSITLNIPMKSRITKILLQFLSQTNTVNWQSKSNTND